jgi:hypothetical protein
MDALGIFFLAIFLGICGYICGKTAKERGKNIFLGALMGVGLNVIGVIIYTMFIGVKYAPKEDEE